MEYSKRPQRNRRLCKRAWPPEDDDQLRQTRPAKRVFTPEIKRILKHWLIRCREKPYPSRNEKQHLAMVTGLTYTQICNWFANWRRKLKKFEHETVQKSWGDLIKNYNTNFKGNAEQLSISSTDSIWEEQAEKLQTPGQQKSDQIEENQYIDINNEGDNNDDDDDYDEVESMERSAGSDGNYSCAEQIIFGNNCHQATKLNDNATITKSDIPKYKQLIMEKYLRDTNNESSLMANQKNINDDTNKNKINNSNRNSSNTADTDTEFNKWLQSAAKFTPNKNNYHIEWINRRHKAGFISEFTPHMCSSNSSVASAGTQNQQHSLCTVVHHKDELDAAEALTNLALNYRQHMVTPTNNA